MNRVHIIVSYFIKCSDCNTVLAGPYLSYDQARQHIPEFRQCNHPQQEDQPQ